MKKYLALGVGLFIFLGNPIKPVLATEITSSSEITSSEEITSSSELVTSSSEEQIVSSEEIISSEDGGNFINDQLAQLENIVVALFVSFTGTGTVALIVRAALSKLTNQMKKKVSDAEAQNKISIEQSKSTIQQILDFEKVLKGQVSELDATVKNLIQNQNLTNENIKMMLEEYKQRDEQIKELIVKEFGDETNE